jgi:hypothetical protein
MIPFHIDERRRKETTMGHRTAFVLAVAFVAATTHPVAYAQVNDLKAGQWSGGTAIGFLGHTIDRGVDFAFKGNLDYFFSKQFSIGPMGQYVGAGSQFIFGLTVQGKYWWDIPGSQNLTKLVAQGGIGFARGGTDLGTTTSFLIPLGIGLDHTISQRLALTADFILNLTDLGDSNVRANDTTFHTSVMPGVYLGIRF